MMRSLLKFKILLYVIFPSLGQYLNGQSLPSFLTTNQINQNHHIAFDSLKYRFEHGDMIVINDWVLMSPNNFFDSKSIGKNSFKGILVDKDSAISKYGNLGSGQDIIEIRIPCMDSLPQANFIDKKFSKYLNPGKSIAYLINGNVVFTYSSALREITNKRIIDISTLDPNSAMAIWGTEYGKNGALIIDIDNKIEAQKSFRPLNQIPICQKLIQVDSLEYLNNQTVFATLDSSTTIEKVDGVISVSLGDSTLVFRDDTSNENYIEYTIAGQNYKYNWILIKGQGYNIDYYYLLDKQNNKVDTLVSNPMIFGDVLLCWNDSFNDGNDFIEVWNSINGNLHLVSRFCLCSCGVNAMNDIYFKEGHLFVKYQNHKYLKLKIQ